MTSERTPWWRRRVVLITCGVVVLALVLGGGLLLRHNRDRGRMAVGASRAGDYTMGDGYFSGAYQFAVPGANITVNLESGRRGTHLDASTYDTTTVRAPRHGLLVHLSWSVTSSGAQAKYVGARKVTHGDVVGYTGGHRTRLSVGPQGHAVLVDPAVVPTGTRSKSSTDGKLVAVTGDLADLRLSLTYQGHTQSVALLSGRRTMGDFAALYSVAPVTHRVTVEQDDPSDPNSPFSWNGGIQGGTMTRLPYLDSVGWAPRGRQWIVFEGAGYYVLPPSVEWSDGKHYAPYTKLTSARSTVTVNGKHPVKSLGPAATGHAGGRTATTRDYVFSVPTGNAVTVDIAAGLSFRRAADGDPQAPAHATMRMHRSDRYPAVIDPTSRSRR